jgi:predicted ArsR family transcriptional regulator
MNRKDFLKNCVCGVCTCAIASAFTPAVHATAEAKPTEDWRPQFIKQRYAKLLEILSRKMDEKTLDDALRQLGAYCASTLPLIDRHKGDVDGYIREFKKLANEDITYDREKGVITITGPERGDCYCPLVDRRSTPKVVCNCSLGWQEYTYETLLGRNVRVELTESVVRGGKRCTFVVHIGDAA